MTTKGQAAIQSVVISKASWEETEALEWMAAAGYAADQAAATDETWTYTQLPVEAFVADSLTALRVDEGISAMVGILARPMADDEDGAPDDDEPTEDEPAESARDARVLAMAPRMLIARVAELPEQRKAGKKEDGYRVRVVASTSTPDRFGDIVEQNWKLEHFRNNPVVPFGHRYDQPPVGRAVSVDVRDGKLVADLLLDDSPNNPMGRTVAHQFRSGYLNAVSVGFRAGAVKFRDEFAEDHPYHGRRGVVFMEPELLEISVVPVPANPEALAAKGLGLLPDVRHVLLTLLRDDAEIRDTIAEVTRPAEEPAPTQDELTRWLNGDVDA